MSRVVARLPDDLRDDLKRPLGPVFTDLDSLLANAGEPLVAVGDVVTAHLERAGRRPDLAVVDERTERSPVAEDVQAAISEPDVTIENPAATLTAELVAAIRDALAADGPTTILVDGEEDLAALPAVLLVPEGGSVVYGQPGEGMVLVEVDAQTKSHVRNLLERFDGHPDRLFEIVDG